MPKHLPLSKSRKRTARSKAKALMWKRKREEKSKNKSTVEQDLSLQLQQNANHDVDVDLLQPQAFADIATSSKISELGEFSKADIIQPQIFTDVANSSKLSESEELSDADSFEKKWNPNNIKTYSRKESNEEFGLISSDEYDSIMATPLEIVKEPAQPGPILGNRIVELGYVLNWAIRLQYNHSKVCTSGSLFVKEEQRIGLGLVSKIIFECNLCERQYSYKTENPDREKSSINYGAVYGTLASGSTYAHTEELFSCIDIPAMPEGMFSKIEVEIGNQFKESLWESMERAGKQEREHAIELNNICDDGTPWIKVFCDGSWSKRSYNSNYNSLSGMVCIVGQHTSELLYIGVRNKYCCVCARAEHKNETAPEHKCYKNWDDSAPAMEADMAVEAFKLSETMHGLRYLKLVGDGDASVFSKIQNNVDYGYLVKKVECTNHILKNYGKHLRNAKKDLSIPQKERKLLTNNLILKLTKRAKTSIYEHAKDQNLKLLCEDLENGIFHVFGNHSKCRVGICNTVGDMSQNKIPEIKNLYDRLNEIIKRIIAKADRLLENETNNCSERMMNVIARFTQGKRLNLVQRGSYERRVYAAALRYNHKFQWYTKPWTKITGSDPGIHFQTYMDKKNRKDANKVRRRQFEADIPRPSKTKPASQKQTDYGKNAVDGDLDPEFVNMESERQTNTLQVTEDERQKIATDTIGQFDNNEFQRQRRHRLTASLFGQVVNRRSYTPCHSLVKSCLEITNFKTAGTEYGKINEDVAIKRFEIVKNLKVNKSGLWVDIENGFLGASPDGLIGEDALVEVKCFLTGANCESLEDWIDFNKNNNKKISVCLERNGQEIRLKRKHNYFYQIQGQLNICKRRVCFFVVHLNENVPLFIEEIERDETLWKEKMLPSLIRFYKFCIAPEIVRGKLKKGQKCVDPPFILDEIKKKEQSKSKGT